DDIDIGHSRVGIFAGQRQVWQIGAALNQHAIGCLLRIWIGSAWMCSMPLIEKIGPRCLIDKGIRRVIMLTLPVTEEAGPDIGARVKELEQIHKVRGGAQHRMAVLTLAEVERAKKRLHRWVLLNQSISGLLSPLTRGGDGKHRRSRGKLLSSREEVIGDGRDLLRLAIDQVRLFL